MAGIDRDLTARQLQAIAGQIRRWLDWSKSRRDEEHITTDGDTHIMSLPVPVWPTHGQFEAWIGTLDAAADALRSKE